MIPEFVHIDVATPLKGFKQIVKGVHGELRVNAVIVYKAQAFNVLGSHTLNTVQMVEVVGLHTGMEDVELAVGTHFYVNFNHIGTLAQSRFKGGNRVAGNVAGSRSAMGYYKNIHLGGVS
jgi:hypothetical protein